jgi:hypothetical protein
MMPFWISYNVKLLTMSCDGVETQREWLQDVADVCGEPITIPLVSDPTASVLFKKYLRCCVFVGGSVMAVLVVFPALAGQLPAG